MAITFDMTGSQFARRSAASLGGLLINLRFGMSAPKPQNGFAGERIVSSDRVRRNIQGKNVKDFNRHDSGQIRKPGL
jgi:hypothetical protein